MNLGPSQELQLALGIGVLIACGVWLLLRPRTFDLVLGLTLLSYGVNLFIFSAGGLMTNKAPIVVPGKAPTLASYADPLPQALVLTAIVISFAMTALTIVIALRANDDNDCDHVDGEEREQ
jgi:multicomponent K+:H+ antiporter subunit C